MSEAEEAPMLQKIWEDSPNNPKGLSTVEYAYLLVQQEKKERAKQAAAELDPPGWGKKWNCVLMPDEQGRLMVIARDLIARDLSVPEPSATTQE